MRYIGASLTNDETVQAEQFAEIQQSVKTFAQTVEVLVRDRNFAGLNTVMLDFIEQQDGVGDDDDDGGGTGLLGDTNVLEAAARYLLRRQKDSDMAAMLMDIAFRRVQGTPSTTKYVPLSDLT